MRQHAFDDSPTLTRRVHDCSSVTRVMVAPIASDAITITAVGFRPTLEPEPEPEYEFWWTVGYATALVLAGAIVGALTTLLALAVVRS